MATLSQPRSWQALHSRPLAKSPAPAHRRDGDGAPIQPKMGAVVEDAVVHEDAACLARAADDDTLSNH